MADIIQALLQQAGKGVKAYGDYYKNALAKEKELLNNLLGSAVTGAEAIGKSFGQGYSGDPVFGSVQQPQPSVAQAATQQPAQQATQQATQPAQQKEDKDAFTKGAESALRKAGTAAIEEVIQTQGPEAAQQVFSEREQEKQKKNVLQGLLGGLNQLAQFATLPIQGNLIQLEAMKSGLEQQKLRTQKMQQTLSGQEPLQKGKREEIALTGEETRKTELLKATFSGKISDRAKQQETADAFQMDMVNLIDAWDNISLKGSGMGVVGAVEAATLGKMFGTSGREARTRFQSLSNGIMYSAGAYIIGQTGRALVEADLKRLEKMAKFTPRMKEGDFRGKIQAILDFSNSKIIAAKGKPQFTNAQQFMDAVRSRSQQQTQGIQQTQPAIQAELDAINQRLAEIGGE